MANDNNGWIRCDERLPELGDYSVLAYWGHGGMDMVHVEDYFGDITSGLDENGNQTYTKLYLSQKVTHWQAMPEAPTK
ncbi:DUF551 domain-containing protein [Proteus vulgaris]|uniref:DUF551 domain-containing protein n=1 Tax=Proteus vulgaris TaxID=585 RepID=UPI002874691F|nr:DUF551 domain-containing protein [Proteus vulgaris]MDS0790039.1 DUF551 domain-containing protein [Proteus vulgaris]